jgi:hypothetical protein
MAAIAYSKSIYLSFRFRCACDLRPVADRLLGLRFRISLRALMFVFYAYCVADGGLCDELINGSKKSYRVCVCLCVCARQQQCRLEPSWTVALQ